MSADLRAELDRLREENRQLREALVAQTPVPVEWRLSPSEARLAQLLLTRPIVSRNTAMVALYAGRASDWPDDRIVEQFVMRVRRKLRPLGVTINSVWGQGWRIVPEIQRQFARAA